MVIICNYNRYSQSKFRERDISDALVKYIFPKFSVHHYTVFVNGSDEAEKRVKVKGEKEYRKFQKEWTTNCIIPRDLALSSRTREVPRDLPN